MRKCVSVAAALALAVLVAACGGSKGETSGVASNLAGSSKSYAELKWGMPVFPGPLEWKKNLFTEPSSIDSLVLQGLVEFESDGQVKPCLASSIEHPNPTTYIYHLRSGVKFSDGKPLTIADVLYSLRRNVDGKETTVKQYWEDVSSISARGTSAVAIQLKRPDVIWPEVLAFTGTIIEKSQAEQVGEKALGTPSGLPVGTGPWKLDSFQPETSVHLSRNPYWTGALQPASKITVSFFQNEATMALGLRSGALDGASYYTQPKTFSDIPGVRQITAPGTGVDFVAMNTTVAPYSDVHVRRAIAYATDVKGILQALYPPGFAAEDKTLAPTASFLRLGSSSEVEAMLNSLPKYEFNLAAAKRELAKSAYPHGLSITLQAYKAQLGIVEVIAADLRKIGVKVSVHQLDTDENAAMLAGKTLAWSEGYTGIYPDPEALLSLLLPSDEIDPPGSGLNSARFNNPEVDKLLARQRETVNPKARLQLVGKLLKIAATEEPYRQMFSTAAFTSVSDKYVYPKFSAWTQLYRPWALEVKLAH